MESGRGGGIDSSLSPKNEIESDLRKVMSSQCSPLKLNQRYVTKQCVTFDQLCKEKMHICSPSSSCSSLEKKPIPGTKHTIDAILGLRNSISIKDKYHSIDANINAHHLEPSESLGSNSKSGKLTNYYE
jgi:hypothetical protein